MSASDFARMKEMERRIALLEQEVAQLRTLKQENEQRSPGQGQKPPLGLKKAN